MKELLSARINFDLFKFNLKRNKSLMIVFTLMFSLTFPAIVLINALSKNSYPLSVWEINTFMIFMALVMILLLVLTPFIFFNYLNSKKSVDVFHSLSITRNDLFITFLALSLFFVIVPLTLAYWGGFILTYLTSDIGFDPYHLYHYGRLLMISVSIMATSIFVIMNTGTLSDSLVYTGIILIAPFVAYGAYNLFAQAHIVGFQTASANSLAYLSPLAGIFFLFDSFSSTIDGHFIASYWLLLGLLANCVSMNLYKEWKSEYSEVPFSNNKFFPLVTSTFIGILFIFLLSVNFLDNPNGSFLSIETLLIPIIFTYSFYLILNIIKFRSINTVKKASKSYLILFLVIMILTSTFHFTQGFGYAYRLPKESDVVSIDINGSFQVEPFLSSKKFVIKDAETIKEILDIHEQMVNYIKEDNNIFVYNVDSKLKDTLNEFGPTQGEGHLDLTYHLKNKDRVSRSYNIPAQLQQMFFGLSDNKEFLYNNHPISDLDNNRIDLMEVYDPLFSEQYSFDFSLKDEDLREAIHNDLFNMDQASYYHSDGPIEMTLVYQHDYSNDDEQSDYRTYQLNIDSRFKETLKFLNKDRVTSTRKIDGTYYEFARKNNVEDFWVGHGISQVLQQEYYGYHGDGSSTTVNLDAYRNNIYDKRLSKESNDVLIVETMYGRTIYPVFQD